MNARVKRNSNSNFSAIENSAETDETVGLSRENSASIEKLVLDSAATDKTADVENLASNDVIRAENVSNK